MSLSLLLQNQLYDHLPFLASRVCAAPLKQAKLIATSPSCMSRLGFDSALLAQNDFVAMLKGEHLPEGGQFNAQVYAGHQFGHFVEQLGDGRAMSLGEIEHDQQRFELQLKGAGLTPYSRKGDGRAVLRSSIREYLASETMAALGIPTTRALSLVASSEKVYRETVETGALVMRASESFIRFGHFEYFFHHNKMTELEQLADYCLNQYYPECVQAENPKQAMLAAIVERTAKLIAKWQAYGFCHGVMNTDNMSILGLTIDYGPFAFMDDYQPSFICNHSDTNGRYAFDQQPSIGLWNLNALALTFSTWLTAEQITQTLKQYEPILVEHYLKLMQKKLGFSQWGEQQHKLMARWLNLMAEHASDYSLSFRLLNTVQIKDADNQHCQALLNLFKRPQAVVEWLADYRESLASQECSEQARVAEQNAINPKFVLRNYMAQEVITAAEQGDFSTLLTLQDILAKPYLAQEHAEKYAQVAPDWSRGISISCSS